MFDDQSVIRLARQTRVQDLRGPRRRGSAHHRVAPSLLRSDALSILYRSVRDGTREEADAKATLNAITTMRIRLLGDRVSRAIDERIAIAAAPFILVAPFDTLF